MEPLPPWLTALVLAVGDLWLALDLTTWCGEARREPPSPLENDR